jgi:hypothetical protein
MTEQEDAFDKWMSRVDIYLEQMVKKLSGDFHYNYLQDFYNKVPPEITATRVISLSYRTGVTNDSNNVHS